MSQEASSSRRRLDDEVGFKLQGYGPATRELQDACAKLFPGQMVCTRAFSLMDSMAALQIMDPRLDSGIFPIPEHLVAAGDRRPSEAAKLPAFDAGAHLTVEDLCWIMDRLMACETAWQQGASLSQTIHTCLYVHSLASIHPSSPPSLGREPNWLVSRILRPYLIGVLKSVGLVWDELSKGNLIDGEDYHGDKAGVSLLEEVHVDEAIRLLQEAIDCIEAARIGASGNQVLTQSHAESLWLRVDFRKNILTSIKAFSLVVPTLRLGRGLDPSHAVFSLTPILQNAQRGLNRLQGEAMERDERWETGEKREHPWLPLLSPCFSDAPSPRAVAGYDPWYSRRPSQTNAFNAPSAPPPPLPLELEAPTGTIESYSKIVMGMLQAVQLTAGEQGWMQWKAFFDQRAIDFQRNRTMPYVRSLWQSVLYSDGVVGLRYELNWIAQSFLYDVAGWEYRSLPQRGWDDAMLGTNAPHSLQKRADAFLERLAGQLVNHLCSLAQNRSRGKRRLAASYGSLLDLSGEAGALDESMSEAVGSHWTVLMPAVQLLTLDTMLHTVLSGFELELHRMGECAPAYWLAFRIAEEQIEVLVHILQYADSATQSRRAFLQSRIHHAKAVAEASKGMQTLFNSPSFVRHGSLPWQPSPDDCDALQDKHTVGGTSDSKSLEALHRVSFAKRFKWFRVDGRPESSQTIDNLWSEWQVERDKVESRKPRERLDRAGECLEAAVKALDRMPTMWANDQFRDDFHISALATALCAIGEACRRGNEQAAATSLLPLTFSNPSSHPWFPVLQTHAVL